MGPADRKWLAAIVCLGAAAASAQDSAPLPLDLLEYLGSWQDDDEEWVLDAAWPETNEVDGRPEAEDEDDQN
jgi:hypothetical protein